MVPISPGASVEHLIEISMPKNRPIDSNFFFIYPTWVKENCKKFSDKNTVCNMVKIHFEKYEKFEKIQNFEIEIAKQMQDHNQLLTILIIPMKF